jgi:hypothetical protein
LVVFTAARSQESTMPEPLCVTLIVATDGTTLDFHRTSAPAAGHPHVLAAQDLRTASNLANRLGPDDEGRPPVPLLHIHAPTPTRPTTLHPHHCAIGFAQHPRLLAGLIADSVRAGVAAGALVVTADDGPVQRQLRADITAHLQRAGLVVSHEVSGWALGDVALSHAN